MNIFNFKNIKSFQMNKGFTLLEVLIAIFMLTIALGSILTLVSNSFFSAKYAKNELTAMYLAQEALDYIHNDRNSIAFQGGDWNTFLSHYGDPDIQDVCYSDEGCSIDVTDWNFTNNVVWCDPNFPINFGTLTCPQFYLENGPPTSSFYHYNIGSPNAKIATFKRHIHLELAGNSGEELRVGVIVEWLNGTSVRSQALRLSLLRWK